jgi:integrase
MSDSTRTAAERNDLLAEARQYKVDEKIPLLVHSTLRWARKIRRKLHYFGAVDPGAPDFGAAAALATYHEQVGDLQAGRTPRVTPDGVTVKGLVDRFLTSKKRMLDSGEIVNRTFDDYYATGVRIADAFGRDRLVEDLVSDDFAGLRAAMARTWGPVRLGNEIQRVRCFFKFAFDEGLTDKPTRYGQAFNRPSKKMLRKARNGHGPKMFEAHEIRAMIEGAATPQHKAMILLGINAGLGNSDCANLPIKALDLKGGWLDFPRPKTAIARRVPLWPETVEALKEVLAKRRKPNNRAHAGLVFVTRKGESYKKDTADNPITKATSKLVKDLGIHRPRVGFYALRHTFETIGGDARDQVAVDAIMGHDRGDMASVYRERISDERLRAVTDHVHAWLFPKEEAE